MIANQYTCTCKIIIGTKLTQYNLYPYYIKHSHRYKLLKNIQLIVNKGILDVASEKTITVYGTCTVCRCCQLYLIQRLLAQDEHSSLLEGGCELLRRILQLQLQ